MDVITLTGEFNNKNSLPREAGIRCKSEIETESEWEKRNGTSILTLGRNYSRKQKELLAYKAKKKKTDNFLLGKANITRIMDVVKSIVVDIPRIVIRF